MSNPRTICITPDDTPSTSNSSFRQLEFSSMCINAVTLWSCVLVVSVLRKKWDSWPLKKNRYENINVICHETENEVILLNSCQSKLRNFKLTFFNWKKISSVEKSPPKKEMIRKSRINTQMYWKTLKFPYPLRSIIWQQVFIWVFFSNIWVFTP